MFNWRNKKAIAERPMQIALPAFAFQPLVLAPRVLGGSPHLPTAIELVFDSNHRLDRARTVRKVMLPVSPGWTVRAGDFKSDITDLPDGTKSQQVRGQMLLDIGGGEVLESPKSTLLLADMDFRLPLRSGTEAYEAEHVRSQVLNAVCRELTVALEGLYHAKDAAAPADSSGHSAASGRRSSPVRTARRGLDQRDSDPEQKRRRWVQAACILSPLTVLAIVLIFGRDPEPSISNADLAAALTPNNEAIQDQVKMTQETLKAMGLDPGQAGDMGCLAPDQ